MVICVGRAKGSVGVWNLWEMEMGDILATVESVCNDWISLHGVCPHHNISTPNRFRFAEIQMQ
jgi:hypothetical protein